MPKLKDGFQGERVLVMPRMMVEQMESDPLTAGLHITDIGHYPKAAYHFRERTVPVGQYILIYCTDGEGWFSIDGERRQRVCANQYFILPPDRPHAYASDEEHPWNIYWVHFKGTLASAYISRTGETVTLNPGMNSRIKERITLFEEIFSTLKNGYSHENLRYVSSLFHHFLGSLCYWRQYRNAGATDEREAQDAIIHYMQENIEKKMQLADMARYAGYSTSHFSALFLRLTGHSPVAYFNLLKVQRACELLDFTDMKVNQISYKVGFDDAYYFSRLFKQVMGISPREYRMMKKG